MSASVNLDAADRDAALDGVDPPGLSISVDRVNPRCYTTGYMGTMKQTAFRLMPEDSALLDALQAKLGIVSRTEIVRMAIRVLAAREGIEAPKRQKPKPRP